jgi:hypothetical protein
MKKIENFGGWIIAHKLGLGVIAMLVLFGLLGFTSPKSVTLDEKHWECTVAVPKGIETVCTVYNFRGR